MKRISIIGISLILAVLTVLTACTDSENTSSTVEIESVTAESSIVSDNESDENSASGFAESSESGESAPESGTDSTEDSSVPDHVSQEPDESSDPAGESSEPETEILGEGTKDSPYLIFPDEDMKMTTMEIPAGETQYYDIYRVGGLELTINSSDAYVICDGTRYDAKNGKVAFRVPNAMPSEAVSFEVGNSGSAAQTFEIGFANPTGTYANPVKANSGTEYTVSLEANNEIGYYYTHIAEKDGTVRFAMTATSDSVMVVTNNRNSAQRTSEDDGETSGDGTKYVEVEVQKGDELIINVGAKLNKRGKYPASDITWSCEYK